MRVQQQQLGVQEQMFCTGTCQGHPRRNICFEQGWDDPDSCGQHLLLLRESFTAPRAAGADPGLEQVWAELGAPSTRMKECSCQEAFKEHIVLTGIRLEKAAHLGLPQE